jgi:hypothetical protein
MSYLRQEYINNIIEKLAFVKSKVEISNPLNLTDVNIISENFYRDFLNLVFGYKLINLNRAKQNSDSIDLADEEKKICIQVTSTSTLAKTKKTVKGFIDNDHYKKYDRLVILNIVSKSKHQDPKIGDAKFYELDTKSDIWDISDLLKEIGDISDISKISSVSEFLDKEVKFTNKEAFAKEVETFLAVINYLSDDAKPGVGNGYIENPDPAGKIYNRFADHSDYLTGEFQSLYSEYGLVLNDVLQQSDMGQARIRRLVFHLKNESDTILTESGNNPKIAIQKLTDKYEGLLQKKGTQFDKTAIRFFLLDQLIKCNVFPNKVITHG